MKIFEKEIKNRINNQIFAKKVRLISENGIQIGIVSLIEAKKAAEEAELDLVEISPNSDPPVVRIMNYGKFLFQENKQQKDSKKKQKKIKIKEIKFRPTTDKADYEIKLRNLRNFLEKDKVKITIFFKGREILYQEIGIKLLEKIKNDLDSYGKLEYFSKIIEGKQLIMIFSPKKK